jgi:hypothetical protein
MEDVPVKIPMNGWIAANPVSQKIANEKVDMIKTMRLPLLATLATST